MQICHVSACCFIFTVKNISWLFGKTVNLDKDHSIVFFISYIVMLVMFGSWNVHKQKKTVARRIVHEVLQNVIMKITFAVCLTCPLQ